MMSALLVFPDRFGGAGSEPSNSYPLRHHYPHMRARRNTAGQSLWWVRHAETKSRNLPCAADLLEYTELMVRLR